MKKKQITAAIPAVLLVLGLILAGCPQATGGGGGDDPIPPIPDDATAYTVKFEAYSGSPAPAQATIGKGKKVTEPGAMTKTGYVFMGWFTEATFANRWNFSTGTVSANMTLYAKWTAAGGASYEVRFESNGGSRTPDTQTVPRGGRVADPGYIYKADNALIWWYEKPDFSGIAWNFEYHTVSADMTLYARWVPAVTDVSDVGGLVTADSEAGTIGIPVYLQVCLDLAQTGNGWRELLDAIGSAGKYVNLILTYCHMTGTAFDPEPSYFSTGKSYIVHITPPKAAKSIAGGTAANPSFKDFSNLKIFYGNNLTDIGDYAFAGCTSPLDLLFLSVARIGAGVFQNTGTTGIDIRFGATPPAVGIDLFTGVIDPKTVTVQVPGAGISNYNSDWGDAFKGGNEFISLRVEAL